MPVTNKHIKYILSYFKKSGEQKTLQHFNLKQDTLRRYLDKGKELGITDIEKSAILRRISEQYTDKELEAISKGGRITPGYSKVPVIDFSGARIKIGVLTDTHYGSMVSNPDWTYQAYEMFKKEKVEFVVHCGDVMEGMSNLCRSFKFIFFFFRN